MGLFILKRHLIWSGRNADGGTSFYYYYDVITWIVGGLALAWLIWFLVRRYLRARALRRPAQRTNYRLVKRTVEIKSELSRRFLPLGVSNNIHAVGIGMLADGLEQYCIQVFVSDPNRELWAGSRATPLPNSYRGVPLVLIEMPEAGFLSAANVSVPAALNQYPSGIRDHQEVIIAGISGANTNLTGQSGTIGYFCTRKSKFSRLKEIHLLSNCHVFADLQKGKVDDGDLIMQPSPGESGANRPIGTLVNFSTLKFDGDVNEPNHIDAAIAKLWAPHQHKPLLPFIGAVKGYVAKKDIKVGEVARKFGRTTGYTEGRIFSIYLDIWIRYDRTRQSAFFQDQLLIEPAAPAFRKFVAKGDSGSLLVDGEQHAVGLIFGGMSEAPETTQALPTTDMVPAINKPPRLEGYGVANPIGEVLERLKIELVV
jgi:hypothetical protein